MVLPADTNEPDWAAITPIFSSSSARAVLPANPAATTATAAPSEAYFIRAFLPALVISVIRSGPLIRSAYCRMTLLVNAAPRLRLLKLRWREPKGRCDDQ